jgi:hypothetical protein
VTLYWCRVVRRCGGRGRNDDRWGRGRGAKVGSEIALMC